MNVEKKVVQCKKYPIQYTLVMKKVKNINMRIEKNGDIVVSANPFIPMEKIDEFVTEKVNWIVKHQEQVRQRQSQVLMEKDAMMLFGKKYKIKTSTGKFNHVSYDEDTILITKKEGASEEKLLQNFLDKLCKDVFLDIAHITYKGLRDYQLAFPTIKIRTMTTRWGSCIPAKQQITLNRRLIHYPIEFIEYVVLHEFVHFIQPNHSKAFYHIVENHMPDYRARMALVH